MNIIKNINKLSGVISPDSIVKLEQAAILHLRHSNITFKIIKVNATELHVRAEQGRPASLNLADKNTLVTRTRELFSQFLSDKIIFCHPVPYIPADVEIVTPEWINNNMLKSGVRVKNIAADTGIDKTNISAWINGKRDMSQIVKAMFYYYFKSL